MARQVAGANVGKGKATASAKAAAASRAASTAAATYSGYSATTGYANPDYYIKDTRDNFGNIITTGGDLRVDSQGNIIDEASGRNYGNMEQVAAHEAFYVDNPTQAIQDVEAQRAQEAQLSSLEQRKAEQAQYAAERAAQEYSGRTSEMYGEMAREAATEGATRPNYEPQSTFTRQTTKDGKRFADSPTSDNYQNVYREESIFGSQTTEVSQGTTDIQKMERMLIDAKINNTERELDSLNQQIALSDQKLKNITSIEKAKNAQKGSSGVAGGITEPYLESSNPEYAAENERMKNLKAQQLQMKKVFDAQTEEKRQKGSLTAAFDRNVQGISRDPAPMDSDPVVADYGTREQGSTPFLTSITDNEALKADNPNSPFAGLTDATPGALEKSQRDDVDGMTAWGGWTPHKGDDRLPFDYLKFGQVSNAFDSGTNAAPSLTIPGTEGAKRDALNKQFYSALDPNQTQSYTSSVEIPKGLQEYFGEHALTDKEITGIMTGPRDDGLGMNYVNIGKSGQAIETYTDKLGRDATRVVRTFDPVEGEKRDTLQAIYARQFADREINYEQKEYFNALTGGQVSISDALTKPRTAQSYTYDGVSGQSDRPDGNLGIWLAEQNLKGDEKMSSITWREPRSTGAPGTESNRSEQKRPVSVPEGTTYTPSFDENYRRMMTPVELVGPPAPQKLTPEATQALGEYIGDVKEFHGSDVTEYQIMYTNPQGAVSIINVAPNDLERNYANLIGLGVQPDSMQLTPQYVDRVAPLSPNIAIASSIFAPRFGDSQAEGKLPPRKSLIGGIDLSTEEGRLQYMQEGEWYEKAFKGVAAEVTNVLYVADNIRKRGVNVDQWSEGWETTVFDTILNPYTKPFESTEFKEFFDTEKALYEQSQATTTQATQAVGIGGTTKQSTDSSPDWMIYLKYMGTDTYSKQYTKEQKKETEFFMDNAWYMVPNTIAFVGTFGINVGLGTVKAIGTTLAKVGLKTASATSSFTPYVTPIKGGFQMNFKALEAAASGTITQKVGIFLQEKAFPVESGITRSLYKKLPSITQFDQPVPKIDKAADLVQLPRQMESLTGSTRGSTDQLYDASGKALGDVEVTFPKGQRTEEFIPKTDVNPTRADDSVGMTSDEIIYLRMDDVGNLPPSRPQPLPSEPPVAREAMPSGWAEGKMSQAPPVAWKQDVITTEVMKVGIFDDIQVFPQTTSVVGKKYTIPKNIPIIGGKEVTVGGQAIRNPGVYSVVMTEAATSRTIETTATIYQKTFPKTGKWGGMFQTKYDPEQTGLGILDPLTGKISDTKLAELPGAIRIPRYGRQGVYTDYYLDMTPIIEQSGLMGTIRGEQLLLSQMTVRTSVAQAAGLTPVSLARGAPKINEQLIGGRLEETVSADMWSALPVTKKTVGKTIPQEQLAIKADQLLQRVIGYSDITGGAGKVDVPTSGLRAGYLDEKGVYRVDKEAVKKNYPEIYEATNMGSDPKYMQGFRDWKAMPKKDLQSTSVSGKGGDQLEYLRSVQQRVDPILSTSVFSSGSRSYPLAPSILKARESWDITNMKIQKLRDDYQSARRDITITEQQTAEYSQAMDVLTTEAIKGKSRIQVLNKELGVVNMQTLRRDQNLQFGQIKNVSGSQMFRVLDDSGLSEKVRLNSGNLANVESKIRALDSDILKTKKTLEDSNEKLKLYETMKDSRTIDQYADVNAQQVTTAYTKGLEDELSKLLAARKQMEVDLSRVRGGSGSTNWMLDTADKAEAGKFESSGELIRMGWREVPVNTGYRQVTPIEMRFLKKSYNEYMSNISAGESLPFSEWLGVGRYDEVQSIRADSITDLKALGGKSDDFDVTLRELQAEQTNQPNYVYGYLDDSGKFIQSDGSKGSLFEVGEKGYASIQSRLLKEDIRSINLRIKGYQSAIVKVKTGGSPFFTDKPVTGTTPDMIGGSDPLASVRATQVAHSIPKSLDDDISRFLVADKKMEKLQMQNKAYDTALLPLYNQRKTLNKQKDEFYNTLKKTLFSTYVRPTKQGDVMNLLKEWVKTQRKVATTGSPDDRYWAKMLNLTSSAIVDGKKVKVDNFRSEVMRIADLTKDIGKSKKGEYQRMDAIDLGLTQNQINLGVRYNEIMNDVYYKWRKNITGDEAADLLRAEVTESSITGRVKVQREDSGGSIGWTEGYTDEAIPSLQGYKFKGLSPASAKAQGGAESKWVKAIGVLADVDRLDKKFANLSKQMRPYEQKLGTVNETINDQTDVMKRITLDTGVTRVGTGSDVGAGRAATFVIPETVGSFVKSYDTTIKILSSAQKELRRLQAQKGGSMKARNTMVKNIDAWSAQLVKDQKYDKTKLPIWGGKQIYVSLSALTQIKTAGGKFGAAGPSRMGAAIFGYITGQPLPGAKTLKDMGLARDAIITKDYIVAKEFGITREPVPVGAEVPARIDSPKLDRALQFFGFKPPPRPKVTQEMFENFLKVVNDESSVVGGVIIPGRAPSITTTTTKANIPIGATLPKGYTQKPIVSTQKPVVTSEEYLKVQDPSYIIKTADDFKLPTSSEWGTGADFAKIRELEGMDYETGAVLGLERLGLVSGQDIATIQQPTFTVGDVMKGLLFGKKSEKKYFVGLVKESFGVGSQPINEYDKAMMLFSQATEKLKLVSKARQDPTEWLDVKPSRFDDTTPGMDEGVKIDTDWKPDISYPSDPNKPYRPQSFQPEDEPSKRMQSMYDAMEKRLQESTGITATAKSEEPSVRVQNIYAQMEEKLKNANIYTTEKGSRLPSGQFVSEYQISNYSTSVIEGVRLGDLPVSNVQQSLLETKLGVGKFVVEGGKLEELVLPPVRPDYKFTEKELVKIEKEAMKLFDEGKKALPSRSLYDTDLKSVPEDLFKNVRSLADDAVVLKNWLGGDFMPAFFRPPPPSRPKSVLRDASKGSFDTSSDDASQRLITMLKTEDVKITKEPLGPTLETVQQVAKADPLKPVMESVSEDILFSAPRNLASSLPYQRPFYPSYRSIFDNVYNTQAPAEADILGGLQGGSASAMAPSIPLARPQVPQLGADPTIQLTMPQLQPVIEGISTIQLPSVATLTSSALRQPQKTLPLLDLTQRLNTGTDLTQVGRQRLQLDGLVLSRTRQILDIPLQEAVRVKPKPLPFGILPIWVDPYDKRRRPKKKKAKKRKKKKIWWDVPDSPFKTFSAKEYKVFTGGEPSSVTSIERSRFPFENWGQY